MTPSQIQEQLVEILSQITPDEDFNSLDVHRPFSEQLGLDSMDVLDIVMELRKRFRVSVPEHDYVHLASMESTIRYLEPRLNSVQPS